MSVKFGGLKRLSKRLGDAAKHDKFKEQLIKALAVEMLIILQKETPEGVYPAPYAKPWAVDDRVASQRLKKGWTGGKSVAPKTYVNGLRIEKSGNGYSIQLVNNVEYASMVNKGHRQNRGQYVKQIGMRLRKSWVVGDFFVERSIMYFDPKGRIVLQERLEKELRRIFK